MHRFAVVRARKRLLVGALLAVLASTLLVQSAGAVSANLVISQVYGGGGNGGATYTHDYIEIFNRGTGSVSLDGMSLQYASATGTGNLGANAGQLTELSGSLAPNQYFLVQEASNAPVGLPLPTPDIADATPIAMAAGAGKVALVSGQTSLECNGGSTPCGAAALARIVDLVGYGNANFFEGPGAAPAISATLAAFRGTGGCVDTDNNSADFAAATPNARNTASPLADCSGDAAPTISSTSPADDATGVALDSNVTITFSEPVDVTGDWFAISCTVSLAHAAVVTGGPTTFTLNPTADFASDETCSVVVVGAQVTDQDTNDPPDRVAGNPSWSFTTASPAPPTVDIHEIQGAVHSSPLAGNSVTTTGIVTARRSNGFYIQDPTPDTDEKTSDGILIFTSSAPTVSVGDSVSVSGLVTEFRPGGASSTNLTITEIGSPTVTVLSSGNPLPATTVIGAGGRAQPTMVIDDDSFAVFDPASDGIDFYESLEAVRVQVNNPVAVGPRNGFGEIYVLADDGAAASVLTSRSGIVIRPGDFNPERIQLDDAIVANSTPSQASVGDHFSGPAVGIMDYDFGNFELNLTSALTLVPGGIARETTAPAAPKHLAVATFNVENLDALEPQSKFDAIAGQIVNNLRSPDILTLEEIQDNNGAVNNGVVDATETYNKLIASIVAAGGPAYDFRQINPVDGQDGGEPGGNIRVGPVLPHRSRRRFRRPARRWLDDADDGRQQPGRPSALVQPGPDRPDQLGVEREPQASRR